MFWFKYSFMLLYDLEYSYTILNTLIWSQTLSSENIYSNFTISQDLFDLCFTWNERETRMPLCNLLPFFNCKLVKYVTCFLSVTLNKAWFCYFLSVTLNKACFCYLLPSIIGWQYVGVHSTPWQCLEILKTNHRAKNFLEYT